MSDLVLFDKETSIGWSAPEQITVDEWRNFGQRIKQAEGSLNWIVGDWLLAHRGEWGEMYNEAMELTGWSYEKLRHCKNVSETFEFVMRMTNLPWFTHRTHGILVPISEFRKFANKIVNTKSGRD